MDSLNQHDPKSRKGGGSVKLAELAGTLVLALALAPLLSGCVAKPEIATPTPQELEVTRLSLTAADGKKLDGMLFSGDKDKGIGVVLAHMGAHSADQTSWISFARSAAEEGFEALTFNFRDDRSQLDLDVRAAIAYLRSQGCQKIVCIGASMGGTACLKAAGEEDLAGLVVISSLWTTGSGPTGGALVASSADVTKLTLPKLFITTEDDGNGVPATMEAIYALAPEPKTFVSFPGAVHGTDIFFSSQADEFRNLLLQFLEDLR
ncbi:MAG: alpha/beta hydrolase [Anaerolineales bacterium]